MKFCPHVELAEAGAFLLEAILKPSIRWFERFVKR
jgi:hypothetical protein